MTLDSLPTLKEIFQLLLRKGGSIKEITMRVRGSEVFLQKFLFPVIKVANSCCDICIGLRNRDSKKDSGVCETLLALSVTSAIEAHVEYKFRVKSYRVIIYLCTVNLLFSQIF
jgi:hypothetical protein